MQFSNLPARSEVLAWHVVDFEDNSGGVTNCQQDVLLGTEMARHPRFEKLTGINCLSVGIHLDPRLLLDFQVNAERLRCRRNGFGLRSR